MLTTKCDGVFNLFISTLLLFFISCTSAPSTNEKEIEVKALPIGKSETIVETSISEIKNFEYSILSNGKIKSQHDQLISCESGGRLLLFKAKTGALFLADEFIGQVDTNSIHQRLEKVYLTRFNSQKEYESQLVGYESLLKGKPREEADMIRLKLRISTGLAGAEQEIKEANYELTKAVIKAPFTGVLADVKVQQGEMLKAGEDLFRIYDPNNLLLEIKILESDISLLRTGTPSEISPISSPEIKYKSSVYEINPYVDENGMVLVRLQITNIRLQKGALFPGMNCTAVVKVPFTNTLLVPKEAVVMRSGKTVVFTLEDGKAKWNYVTLGKDNGKEIEIKEGLKPGQKVIITNNLQLAHDAPVKQDSTHGSFQKNKE